MDSNHRNNLKQNPLIHFAIAKAMLDSTFKNTLIGKPKETLTQLGLELSELSDVKLIFTEEERDQVDINEVIFTIPSQSTLKLQEKSFGVNNIQTNDCCDCTNCYYCGC